MTSQVTQAIYVETHKGENHKSFFLFILNSIHIFLGYDLMEESTPKK